MKTAYLDNNATTACDPAVVSAMLPFFSEQFGNPSSMHEFGSQVEGAIRVARSEVQQLLGAAYDSEIMFTSCASESNNTAILSALKVLPDRKEIITSAVEHPAVLSVCKHLAEHEGYTLHILPVDGRGRIDLAHYESLLSERTALVSIMWANNETGTLFPVLKMAEMAKKVGAIFHTDAVQAAGKVPINLKDSMIDMLSLSGHKLHAPKGVGVLYLRRGLRYRPLLRGGHQERGRRAGTENVTGIVGLGVAARLAREHMNAEWTTVKRLRDRLEVGILCATPYAFVTGDPENRLPNTANIAFEYIEGEAILLHLNHAGIAASSGSACTSGSLEPSHVMRAMGIPYTAAHGTVRFSLSRYTTEAEVEHVIATVPKIIANLRKLSPYWGETGPAQKAFQPEYA